MVLKFVSGHDSVVQPVCTNIIFGYKQAHQYSRTYQLGFVRAVSWSAWQPELHWSRVHITLIVEHINYHAFYKKCG